jgi:hypothetical protein
MDGATPVLPVWLHFTVDCNHEFSSTRHTSVAADRDSQSIICKSATHKNKGVSLILKIRLIELESRVQA